MSINPVDIVIGALRGAATEVLRPVVHQVAQQPAAPPAPAPVIDTDLLVARIEERLRARPEVQQAQEATAPIPWWQSTVFVGSLVALLAPLLGFVGINLAPADQTQLVQLVTGLLGAIGGLAALWSRVRSKAQPVTTGAPR